MSKITNNESKAEALRLANSLSQDFQFEPPIDEPEVLSLRLIGFCLRQLNVPTTDLYYKDGGIQNLLDFNDISYRIVSAPEDPLVSEYPVLIATNSSTGEPVALFRRSRVNYYYCPSQQKSLPVSEADFTLEEVAFEIYPSLPASVDGPLHVLGFTFSAESRALIAFFIAYTIVTLFNLSIPLLTNFLVS